MHSLSLKKFSALPLAVILFLLLVASFMRLAVAASPEDDSSDSVPALAQENGVTLEKQASSEEVPLGQVVTYTIYIANEGTEPVQATLNDELPKGLSLQILTVDGIQRPTISATLGVAQAEGTKLITWGGDLAPGEEAEIIYHAIPPSTSSPNEEISNVAQLQFGETQLEAGITITTLPVDLGWWGGFVNFIATALVFFDGILADMGVPYNFGFAIILFTLTVRLATFPLNLQQIKSSKAMQDMRPQLEKLQEKYKNDREKLAQEQMRLYKEYGVNPLGGCLPMLVQMPIWFALYRALIQLSQEGLLTEGFFWIPSLSGPVTDYTGGISWLWPLPPSVGWEAALAYMVMPVLLVVSQLYTQQMMMPANSDPQQASVQNVMKFMPLMFGYFALVVPSGLTLYWFTSNLLAIAQTYFTKARLDAASEEDSLGTSSASPVPASSTPANSMSTNSSESKRSKDAKKRKKRKR